LHYFVDVTNESANIRGILLDVGAPGLAFGLRISKTEFQQACRCGCSGWEDLYAVGIEEGARVVRRTIRDLVFGFGRTGTNKYIEILEKGLINVEASFCSRGCICVGL
jgi:hypothetical protein